MLLSSHCGSQWTRVQLQGKLINVFILVSAAKTHGGGEDHQMAEDAEELG